MPHINELYDFTVSAYIMHPTEPKLCLHYHKKLRKWLQPGGHIELNEDPLQALEHELLEETGLTIKQYNIIEPTDQPRPRNTKKIPLPININVHSNDSMHSHIDYVFLVKSSTVKLLPQQGESPIIEWLTIDEIYKKHKSGDVFDGTLDICQWIFDKYM